MTPRVLAIIEENDVEESCFFQEVREAMKVDEEAIKNEAIFNNKGKAGTGDSGRRIRNLKRKNGLHYYKQTRLYIPEGELSKRLLMEFYDSPFLGHKGVLATKIELAKRYFWPYLALDVGDYVKSCVQCQMNKHSTQAKIGKL